MKALEFNQKDNPQKIKIYQEYCNTFNKLFSNEDYEMFTSIANQNKNKSIEDIFMGIHWIIED